MRRPSLQCDTVTEEGARFVEAFLKGDVAFGVQHFAGEL